MKTKRQKLNSGASGSKTTAANVQTDINENKRKTSIIQLRLEKDQAALKAKIVDLMETELRCSICQMLFIKATSLSCGHSFCKLCIDRWMKRKKECPNCRQPITSVIQPLALDSYIDNMVDHFTEEQKASRRELVDARKAQEKAFYKPAARGAVGGAVGGYNTDDGDDDNADETSDMEETESDVSDADEPLYRYVRRLPDCGGLKRYTSNTEHSIQLRCSRDILLWGVGMSCCVDRDPDQIQILQATGTFKIYHVDSGFWAWLYNRRGALVCDAGELTWGDGLPLADSVTPTKIFPQPAHLRAMEWYELSATLATGGEYWYNAGGRTTAEAAEWDDVFTFRNSPRSHLTTVEEGQFHALLYNLV